MAFGPDNTLYASYDVGDVSLRFNEPKSGPGEIYRIDPKTGVATFLLSSKYLTGVQDLSSCALPGPKILASKVAVQPDAENLNRIEYTINVSNVGGLNGTGVKLVDALDGKYKFISAEENGKKVEINGGGNPYGKGKLISSPGQRPGVIVPESPAIIKLTVEAIGATSLDGTKACNQAKVEISGNVVKTDDPKTSEENDATCVAVPGKPGKGKVTIRKASYDPKTHQSAILPDLGGAEFSVYSAKEAQQELPNFDAKVAEIRKDKGYTFEIEKDRVYYLVETKAPQGLSLLPEPVKLVTKANGAGKIVVEAVNSLNVEVRGDGDQIVVTVNDVHTGDLPLSGGYGVWLPGLVGLFIVLGGLVLAIRHGHTMNALAIRR
ncbi:SpaA isopeptide-forming pilin-related protein [Arcanobacterium phocae]|uniref:SpaA isopeptide-forming pilin-related protein n=1 Tax=Arcanobacterium phocae TaxID=131112 RepID=UPI001C0F05F7|nr:SpaA isopeptide-forming pilin-related protein [Arcanobacterium phocae]